VFASMSDATQGPGWWQASDGKWYPPEQHPDYTPPTQAADAIPPTAATPTTPPVPPSSPDPTQAMAPVPPPPGPAGPSGPPLPPVVVPPRGPAGPPPPGSGRGRVIAIVAVLAAIAVVAALLLLNRDSDDDKVAASDSASTDQTDATDATDSTDETTTTKKVTTTTARPTTTKPTTTTAPFDAAALTAKLLTVQEMGDGLTEATFTADSTHPEACGQPNIDGTIPPLAIVGRSAVQSGVRGVLEQVRAYADAATGAKAFDRSLEATSCSQGNAFDPQGNPVPITIEPAQDVTADLNGAKRAVAIKFSGQQFEALVIAVDLGSEVAAFQFESRVGAGTETVEARLPIAQAGVDKLLAG
jgi:hypothetical protein